MGFIRVVLANIALLLLTGCGISNQVTTGILFHPYSLHRSACGPTAISRVYAQYGQFASTDTISERIIARRDPAREFLISLGGIFDEEAYEITFEDELVKECESKDYNVTILSGSHKDLRQLVDMLSICNKSGIALSRSKQTGTMHYEAFPPSVDVGHLYKENCEILRVFIIVPKTYIAVIHAASTQPTSRPTSQPSYDLFYFNICK